MIRVFVLFFLTALSSVIFAQNIQPTQLLSTPFLMCPAQVGNSESPRASMMYKNDWAGSCLAGFDAPLKKLNGGAGLFATFENQRYNRSRLTAQGVYSFLWNINDDFDMRSAFYLSMVNIRQDEYVSDDTNYVFMAEPYTRSFLDEGLSIAFDFKKFSFGLSGYHLLRPKTSPFSSYRLDRTFSFFVGYDLWMMKGEKHKGIGVSPLLYLTNENSDLCFTIGFDFVWNNIFAGAYYRAADFNIVTLIYHAGARVGRFQFGYAFDKTESDLFWANSSGHEVFLNYFFEKK